MIFNRVRPRPHRSRRRQSRVAHCGSAGHRANRLCNAACWITRARPDPRALPCRARLRKCRPWPGSPCPRLNKSGDQGRRPVSRTNALCRRRIQLPASVPQLNQEPRAPIARGCHSMVVPLGPMATSIRDHIGTRSCSCASPAHSPRAGQHHGVLGLDINNVFNQTPITDSAGRGAVGPSGQDSRGLEDPLPTLSGHQTTRLGSLKAVVRVVMMAQTSSRLTDPGT